MVRYQKGTMGKLIVQDWDVLETFSDANVLRWISPRQSAALIALAGYLSWRTRYANPPSIDTLDAFEAETRYNLMTEVDFCALMILCITTDTDVQDALVNFFIDQLANNPELQQAVTNVNYYNETNINTENPATTGNILERANCIKDNAAGYVKDGIVDLTVQNVLDFLQVIVSAANEYEIRAAWLDAIPVVGALLDELVVLDFVTFAANVSTWILDAFESEDTTEIREQTYRDLLCIYMNDCSLSVDQIRDYFWRKAIEVNPGFGEVIGTAVDMFNFFITGNGTPYEGIWYVLQAIQFGTAFYVDELFGMSIELFKLQAARGEPTDDWIVWEALYGECECYDSYTCGMLPDEWEVTAGLGGLCAENIMIASSAITPFPGSSAMGADFEIVATGKTHAQFIFQRHNPLNYVFVINTDIGSFEYNPIGDSYVSPDRYAVDIDFPDCDMLTGFLVKSADGDAIEFDLYEIRVFEVC